MNDQVIEVTKAKQKKEKPHEKIFVPTNIQEKCAVVFGSHGKEKILDTLKSLIHEAQTTWGAIECALDNLESGVYQVVHIRRKDFVGDNIFDDMETEKVLDKGGCTIIFTKPTHPTKMLYISVAWCNNGDNYSPSVGRLLASIQHAHNRVIPMRLQNRGRYSIQLKQIFNSIV